LTSMKSHKVLFFLAAMRYAALTVVSHRERPWIGGIALNDRCNLRCHTCTVSNRGIPDLTFDQVRHGLEELHHMGIRSLYLEGGEPLMWHDQGKGLEDVIDLARDTGFLFITLYTNGTFAVETGADVVFVSLDGLKENHEANRGRCYDRIMSNIASSSHKKIFINYTITRKNEGDIERFCLAMASRKNIKGTFFYFYTPYHGEDDLWLSQDEKKNIIIRLLDLKKRGFPILNSKPGLLSVARDSWRRPNGLAYLYADGRMYRCCRAVDQEEICMQCGYLGFTEIYHITRLHPQAVMTAFKYL
jgi:MoaA/NifB/PqqE/SkfB family radical SAM enzyme